MAKNTQIGLGEKMKGTMGEDGDNQKVGDHLEILEEIMMIRLKEQVTKPWELNLAKNTFLHYYNVKDHWNMNIKFVSHGDSLGIG